MRIRSSLWWSIIQLPQHLILRLHILPRSCLLKIHPLVLIWVRIWDKKLWHELLVFIDWEDWGFVALAAIIRAWEHCYVGLFGLVSFRDGLVASDNCHEIIFCAECVRSLLGEFQILSIKTNNYIFQLEVVMFCIR